MAETVGSCCPGIEKGIVVEGKTFSDPHRKINVAKATIYQKQKLASYVVYWGVSRQLTRTFSSHRKDSLSLLKA